MLKVLLRLFSPMGALLSFFLLCLSCPKKSVSCHLKVKFLTWGSLTTFSDGNTCADVCLQCFSDPITRKTLKDVGGGARLRNINLPNLFADYFTEDFQLLDRHWLPILERLLDIMWRVFIMACSWSIWRSSFKIPKTGWFLIKTTPPPVQYQNEKMKKCQQANQSSPVSKISSSKNHPAY